MRPEWTGEVAKILHLYGITMKDVANEMGVSKSYVSLILSGGNCSPLQQNRLETAVQKLVYERR